MRRPVRRRSVGRPAQFLSCSRRLSIRWGGIVTSMAHPGGNITGFTLSRPRWRKVAATSQGDRSRRDLATVMLDPDNPYWAGYVRAIEWPDRHWECGWNQLVPGMKSRWNGPSKPSWRAEARAGRVAGSGGKGLHRDLILALAVSHRLPTVYPPAFRQERRSLSYGVNIAISIDARCPTLIAC